MPNPLDNATRSSPRGRAKPRRIWRRVGAVALGCALALLAAEAALRVWVAIDHPAAFQFDERLGWRHVPGIERHDVNELGETCVLRYDERGLRASPHPTARTPGVARVLFVGDSFTEGSMVDEPGLWTVLVQERLGEGVEVFNAGHGGYGTVQQILWIEDEGRSYRPDVVVHAFFANDPADNVTPFLEGVGPRPFAELEDGEVVVRPVDPAAFGPFLMPFPARFWFYRHSAVYRSLHKNVFLPVAADRLRAFGREVRARVGTDVQVEIQLELLSRMRRLVEGMGATWALVLVPAFDQAARGHSDLDPLLLEWARRRGVPCLSLLGALTPKSPDAPPNYLPADTHWTRAGHACAADAVEPFVRELLRVRARDR